MILYLLRIASQMIYTLRNDALSYKHNRSNDKIQIEVFCIRLLHAANRRSHRQSLALILLLTFPLAPSWEASFFFPLPWWERIKVRG